MGEIQETFYHLGVALAIGLLIGVERGWKERAAREGQRIAGIRTYGLIGLMGGGTALLAGHFGALAMGMVFVGVAGVLTTAYVVNLWRGHEDIGVTSLVAGLLVFILGVLAGTGEVAIAAASAVISTLLLSYKPVLHRWVSALEDAELRAGIKLLLISVVLLPVLPNQGYGPWQVLNPYLMWWMVVLIAAISFVGYFAIKIGGPRRGPVFAGLFGGLASSTAVTLHFSRMAHQQKTMTPMLATGILLACGTMMPRILVVTSIINIEVFIALLAPAVVMAVMIYAPAFYYWRSQSARPPEAVSPLKNPLELKMAVSFGLILVVVMLLGKALQHWYGDTGVLVIAVASGIADVDAITLSLTRLSQTDLAVPVAVLGIVIAATANSLVKAGMASAIGGSAIGLRVGLPLLGSALAGLLTAWLWVW
ncbi:MAG: MgtC/SapB family protein [Gammaproteobacteria bacterium]|nr:MgtC/SapB family protein [Gammaproteobacteria bacterium]